MLFKVKYVGTLEPSLTVNNVYVVVDLPAFSSTFTLIDDNGNFYTTNSALQSASQWAVVSIEYPGLVKLYP